MKKLVRAFTGTKQYEGFKLLDPKTKELHYFPYKSGRKNTDVENEAISKLKEETGYGGFMVYELVKSSTDAKVTAASGEDVCFKVTLEVTMSGEVFDRYSDDSDDIQEQIIHLIEIGQFEFIDSEYC